MEIFKDYAEYIVGIPSFIVATILAIWIYRKQNLRKKLSFTILANEEIINYTDDIKDELEIKYDGQIIEKLYLMVIGVFNNGTISIKKEDFEGKLKLETGEISPINFEISAKKPKNINVSLNEIEGSLELSPCLLNPTDYFSIKILTEHKITDLKLTGRIADVKEITELQLADNQSKPKKWFIAIMFSFYIILISLFLYKYAMPTFMEKMFKGIDSFETNFLSITMLVIMIIIPIQLGYVLFSYNKK